jgi:hypothetical protein
MSRRWRGELHKRARLSLSRIRSHGPLPRTAPRMAHKVIRKRDQGLCVRGLCFPCGAQFVAPGGKWARRLHQALCQGCRDEARQHPTLGCRPFPGRKGIEVEQRLESFKKQFDLPAQSIKTHDAQSRQGGGIEGSKNPNHFSRACTRRDGARWNPIDRLFYFPDLVALGGFRGDWY